jgi:hypothetical protein
MVAVPIKPEYGPTLGRLLAPWWHRCSVLTRRVLIACGVVLLAGVVALVLTLLNATYSHGSPVPFSFAYRGLYSVAPEPGGYVRIEKRTASRRLEYSLAVDPLTLPPYVGDLSGELPMYASGYIEQLRRSYPDFVLIGEGKTRVNTVPAYDVLYTARVEGRTMYGKNVLLVAEHPVGRRAGVDIVMLTAPGASRQIEGPIEVGTTGVLMRPLRSFNLG